MYPVSIREHVEGVVEGAYFTGHTSLSKVCSFRQSVSKLAHLYQSSGRSPPPPPLPPPAPPAPPPLPANGCDVRRSMRLSRSTQAWLNPAILQTLPLPLEPTTEIERAARLLCTTQLCWRYSIPLAICDAKSSIWYVCKELGGTSCVGESKCCFRCAWSKSIRLNVSDASYAIKPGPSLLV